MARAAHGRGARSVRAVIEAELGATAGEPA